MPIFIYLGSEVPVTQAQEDDDMDKESHEDDEENEVNCAAVNCLRTNGMYGICIIFIFLFRLFYFTSASFAP